MPPKKSALKLQDQNEQALAEARELLKGVPASFKPSVKFPFFLSVAASLEKRATPLTPTVDHNWLSLSLTLGAQDYSKRLKDSSSAWDKVYRGEGARAALIAGQATQVITGAATASLVKTLYHLVIPARGWVIFSNVGQSGNGENALCTFIFKEMYKNKENVRALLALPAATPLPDVDTEPGRLQFRALLIPALKKLGKFSYDNLAQAEAPAASPPQAGV